MIDAMQIRSATRSDAKRISSLIHSLSGSFMPVDGASAEPFLASISEQAIGNCISASNFLYFVAEVDDELAGVVALRDNRHLYHLFVAQAHQGKGLGRSLWLMAEKAALAAGGDGRFTVNRASMRCPSTSGSVSSGAARRARSMVSPSCRCTGSRASASGWIERARCRPDLRER